MTDRLDRFYTGVNVLSLPTETLISCALKELGIATERLQIAVEMMHRQQQELEVSEQVISVERQRYQDLLEFAPGACLTTTAAGVVQAANQRAADLLRVKPSFLPGQSLLRFVSREAQPSLQAQLTRFRHSGERQELQLRLQPQQGSSIRAIAIVKASNNALGSPSTLHWTLRETACQLERDSPYADFTLHSYDKGEIIPSESQAIWQVYQGLVKLTTFSSTGEEMLAGLAGASAPFGPNLVASPIYQAIAVKDTQLWRIPMAEIAASPRLAQGLLPYIGQRLRQSEILLTVYGQQRVEDRFSALLLFLKQEVGEPASEGTRLTIRFTHEELATACRTTRVTITRMLGQFVQRQKVSLDSKLHLIVKF